MATLSSHLVAPSVSEISLGAKTVRSELEFRSHRLGGLGGGEGLCCEVEGMRVVRGWGKVRRVAVGCKLPDGVFSWGKSPEVATLQVVALSGIAAPVVEDPVDLVVDQPAKPEPLPSVTEYLRVMPDSLQYEAGKLGGISDRTKDLKSASQAPTAISYFTRILTAKVYDVAIESPLEPAKKLSERFGVKMLVKREHLQPVGFLFILRGAYNITAKLPREQLKKGVIFSSAGNHAQGVALAARKLNCDAITAMPVTTSEIKVSVIKSLSSVCLSSISADYLKYSMDSLCSRESITEFNYRYTSNQEAFVLYSVGLHKNEELSALKERMESAGMRTMDLTNNDLAKDHLQHLMGGRTHVEHELFYRFVFPERQGALMRFLDTFSPSWNITLVHYRSQGEMGANVLVALQVVKKDKQEFIDREFALGYEFQDECNNEALKLILR